MVQSSSGYLVQHLHTLTLLESQKELHKGSSRDSLCKKSADSLIKCKMFNSNATVKISYEKHTKFLGIRETNPTRFS